MQYLTLLKEAYSARLRELQLSKAEPAKLDDLRRRLKALGGDSPPVVTPEPLASIQPPEPSRVVPPPIPEAPTLKEPAVAPPLPSAGVKEEPPLLLERTASAEAARGSDAFAAKRYEQAAALFAQAIKLGETLTPEQRDEWAYSRLHGVAVQLNRGQNSEQKLTELAQEVDSVAKNCSARLLPFTKQLREKLPASPALSPTPTSVAVETKEWEKVETTNFRIWHRGQVKFAREIGDVAEAARNEMSKRWYGAGLNEWAPRCDVYVHLDGATYAKATGKPATHPGHSIVELKAGQVSARRIDLRSDEPTLLDGPLPHEVTQVLLIGLFSEQQLPRWAMIGMSALAESPAEVRKYARTLPQLLQGGKIIQVAAFLEMNDFSPTMPVDAFYAESVSLVTFLVQRKDAKTFAAFIREAPRRGFDRALHTNYGIRDAGELQTLWLKAISAMRE